MKKVNTIYESKNYSMFKRMRGNREINERHVQYFVKELSKNGMQIPGKINALNEIREGQHRFEACKRLKIPFMFFIEKKQLTFNEELDQLMAIQVSKKWNFKDVLRTQCIKGNLNYIRLKEVSENYSDFTLQTIVYISNGSTTGFRDGEFNSNGLLRSIRILDFCRTLKPFFKNYNKQSFVQALSVVIRKKNFDWEYFKEKAINVCDKFHNCTNKDAFEEMIIDIYNYKRKHKI